MVLDPNTGTRADVFDGCSDSPRVSPDGKLVAFQRNLALSGPRSGSESPAQKGRRDLDARSEGRPPVWSPDGKQLVISIGREKPGGS